MRPKRQKENFALSMLISAFMFCVQAISLGAAGLIAYWFMKLGVLSDLGIPREGGIVLLLFVVLISIITGTVIVALTQSIPTKLFQGIIDRLNQLASGDFKARLEFGCPLKSLSCFAELSDSFNAMARELEQTELLRSDFINNFSHEFKTPIVSIAGFTKLLRRGNLTQAQKDEYLAIIEEESLRLSDMATNVLNVTKVENQTILTDVTPYNLSEQLRSCVLLLENRWTRKNLSLELDFDEYTILANEELLKQVWINLLDNAIKFSPPTGEIVLKIDPVWDSVQVSITNFGSDIPADKQEKIFNKFYQADESHGSKGNGVGLAIVKQIVELHHGTVQVDSADGKTTFAVLLPKAARISAGK